MISKLREILLTQYIGSILIALLLMQAVIEAILRVVRIASWFTSQSHSRSLLSGSPTSEFPWDGLVFSLVTMALYSVTGYALARWLFFAKSSSIPSETLTASNSSEQQ